MSGRCSVAACPPSACRNAVPTWRCRRKHRERESRTARGGAVLPAPGCVVRLAPSRGRAVGLVAVSRDRNVPVIRDLLAQVATGPVGISPDFGDALDTSRALETAAVARRCLPPSSTGVASIDDDWAAALLAGAPEISARVVHRLLGRVADLAPAERDILLTTLRT